MLKENLKRLRENKNLTKTQLGKNTGVSFRTIEYIELGKITNPQLRTLRKLSDFFHISIDSFIK